MANNMAEVARLMQGVIDGSVTAQLFARHIQSRSGDTEWLVAFGHAMRDLGGLIERTATIPFERQKAKMAEIHGLATRRQDELARVSAERNELQATVRNMEKELAKTRQDIDFLSMFSAPTPREGEDAPGGSPRAVRSGRFSSLVDKAGAREREARKRAAAEEAARRAATAASSHEKRQERILVHSKTYKEHEKTYDARLKLLEEAHQADLERARNRYENDRIVQKAAADSREELAAERRKKEERRLKQAELEAETALEREASSRAQAAAAADILREQAQELSELRAELERVKLELQGEKAKAVASKGGIEPPINTRDASPLGARPSSGVALTEEVQ